MWSADGDRGSGAGGFLDSTYNGESTQASKPDQTRGNAVVPLMIGHLLADESIDNLKLWGNEIKLVRLVGYVRKFESVTTKISYELVDETGSIMAYQWIEDGMTKGPITVPVGCMAQVIGSPRGQGGKIHIFILKIMPVNKYEEVFEHLAEVTYVCLKAKELFSTPSIVKPAPTMDESINEYGSGITKEHIPIFKLIKEMNHTDTGIKRSELKMKLPESFRNNLDEILEFLVCEGHVYTTCTDDHFKTT